MSDNIPPTVELLVKELRDVTNWFVFGVALGVPVSKLNCIKSDNSDVENKKIQMFQFWLQYKVDASWKMVIQALEQNNYLVMATELSKKYLLSDSLNTSEEEQEKSTNKEVNESTAEIRATAAVVERLRDLETSFTNMLTDLLGLLTECKCDLSKAQFFLDDRFDTDKFSQCTNFDALLRQLRRGHVDTFNTYYLQQLVAYFKKDQLTERVKEYEAEKEKFLKDTTVIEFQRAVVSRVESVKPSQMKNLTIKISKKLAEDRTLKDMEELASRAFGEYQLEFVRIHVKLGSVIISWFFPETLTGKLEQLAHKNSAVFEDARVVEVTVDGRVVFPSTLEEELKDIPTASLKEIYTDFYHRLVEAVSDEHTCQSLLNSSALISEEKIAQLTSSKVTGSSFLKTLGLEEEPHLLVPLVSAMSGVKQLQTLAGEISATMKSNQAKAITQDTERRQPDLDERQQLVADIERLTSDKADLLTRLQCCEEDLKTANECMMAAVHRRDTDVKEREEWISHSKKQLEELRRESGGRESLLTREIEDLKSKLMTKTDELNEAIESNSELSIQIMDTTHQLKDKDDKIKELETRLKNLEDYRSIAYEENSQTELAEETESLPSSRRKPETIPYLSSPSGMVITQEGHLIVVEDNNHCITIINTDSREVINSFGQYGSGQVEFQYPEGVSLTPDDGFIVVADSSNDRLQVLTVEGAFIAAVGSKGSLPLQFDGLCDVAVHHNGKLFVTELLNHRVQVLNPDLSYSHCFGSEGDKPGELSYPHGIAIDQDGMVYVSDYGNNRIQKFTPEGNVLEVTEVIDTFRPYGLCIDSNNILYVAVWINGIVLVLDTSLQILGYVGNSDGSSFNSPQFITTDNSDIYISECNGVVTSYKCYQP